MTSNYIYQFFSNRNLLQWPKSNQLIISDIYNELSLSSNSILQSLLLLNNKYKKANELYKKFISYSMMDKFYNHITNTINIEDYLKLSNLNKYKAYKKIFRISIPNYIFTFIELHKSLFPIELIEKIFPILINLSYSNNITLNNYIKRTLLLRILLTNSKDKSSIMNYYNYNRFLYMYTLLKSYNLEPIIYNPNSGSMYFTISYSKQQKKEQIFESILLLNNKNVASIIIDDVKLYINTQIGEISQVKNICDKRKRSKYSILDNIEHKTPNIIRKIIHDLISKYSNKSYKYSYNQLLGCVLKNNIIVEDYCEKISLDGSILNVPIIKEDSFIELDSSEVRKLNINSINNNLLLSTYHDILNPILRVISTSKI